MLPTVRHLTRPELDIALDWAAREGWNPGLHDAEPFHAADPEGFFGIFLNDTLVGSLSAVRYGENFAFIGLYIVHPDFRGQGHGVALWRTVMDTLGARVVGLDGVVERQADYARSGFALAYRNVRYAGLADKPQALPAAVRPVADWPFEMLVDYDTPLFPAPRPVFLRQWIAQPGTVALGYPDGEGLAGYGVLRRCRQGYKIGPLFAQNAEVAEALFLALRSHADEGEPVFMDVPMPNAAAVALAERHGMTVVFETARMYRGPAPTCPLDPVFGITTFELG